MNTVNSLKEQLKKLDQEYLNVAKLYPNNNGNIISFEGDLERFRINSLKKEVKKKINALEGTKEGGRRKYTKKAKKSKKAKKTRRSK